MTDLSSAELARIRVRLDQLPGFDPLGLWIHPVDLDYTAPGNGHYRVISTIQARAYGCAIDLADAATRDRVARWAALRLLATHTLNVHESCTAPTFELGQRRGNDEGPGVWLLSLRPLVLGGGGLFQEFDRTTVPALEDLAWHDGCRLPDGSRWVDAAALAEVARHVGRQGK